MRFADNFAANLFATTNNNWPAVLNTPSRVILLDIKRVAEGLASMITRSTFTTPARLLYITTDESPSPHSNTTRGSLLSMRPPQLTQFAHVQRAKAVNSVERAIMLGDLLEKFDVSGDIFSEIVRMPPEVIKPFVDSCIRHCFFDAAQSQAF